MSLYERNKFYISASEQAQLKKYKIFLAGCGIGSVVAECAVRLGFENITIADGDIVDMSNLNRQNYTTDDIGIKKVEAIKRRLLSINPNANIKTYDFFLTASNINHLLDGYNVAINALDFQSSVPFKFDAICQRKNIPVLHPYNIGWAAHIFVVTPGNSDLTVISKEYLGFEKEVAKYLIVSLKNRSKVWVEKVLHDYENDNESKSPPQLSISSWLAGGACVNIIYRLASNKPVKQFPEYYFITIGDNLK